ncbi:type VI secretion system baseplate subunit TssE [Leptothrix ochracea]|uniref:type VI secretion system baseplate subunit TssE n=1 Tax=Leptothrix ochracea TaxID=735331 RepID=UPI0034E2D575
MAPVHAPSRDRLQPALLDRLTDDGTDADQQHSLSRSQLRAAVLRDLSWLLNAVQPMPERLALYPHVAHSVLNYGLVPVSGQLASKIDIHHIERDLREALLRFEPRLLEEGLSVQAVETSGMLDRHNVIEFEIRGFLWAQPVPLELLLRTQLDLEAGQVRVQDLNASQTVTQTGYV